MPTWLRRLQVRRAGVLSTSGPEARTRAMEQWFVRRGLPHFIHGYSAAEDVWTRALPLLFVLYLLSAFDAYFVLSPDGAMSQVDSTSLPLLLVGLVVIIGPWLYVNRREGRPLFARPARVGRRELAAFVLVPALLTWLGSRDIPSLVVSVVVNGVALWVIYTVTSYGLVRLTRWVLGRMVRQTALVFGLVVRALPLLLVIVALLLLTNEVWQTAGTLQGPGYVIALLLLLGAAFVFLTTSLAREVRRLQAFGSWHDVDAVLSAPGRDGGLGELVATAGERPALDELPAPTRRQRANATLVMLVNQTIQIAAVSLVAGLFLTVFGLFAVPRAAVELWVEPFAVTTLSTLHVGGSVFEVTEPLVRVTGFITAFLTLFLSVAALTDETYRREFYADTEAQLRLAFAVRLQYLAGITRPVAQPST